MSVDVDQVTVERAEEWIEEIKEEVVRDLAEVGIVNGDEVEVEEAGGLG